MSEPKWIQFIPGPSKAKTLTWFVVTKDQHTVIGEIRWYGPWRKYAFFPGPETVYENQCLHDIADFIELEMEKRRHQ